MQTREGPVKDEDTLPRIHSLPDLHSLPEVAQRHDIPLRLLREMSWAAEFEHIRLGRERYVTDRQQTDLLNLLVTTPVGWRRTADVVTVGREAA